MDQVVAAMGIVLPVIVSLLGFANAPYTRKLKKRSKAVEELEFLSAFLAFDVSKRPRLIVEQGFSVFWGYTYSYDQILHMLKFNNPSSAFNLYRKTRHYLELKNGAFDWAKKKKPSDKFYSVRYFISLYIGLYPAILVFLKNVSLDMDEVILLAVWTLMFSVYALEALSGHEAIESAEKLLKEQKASGIGT